MPASLPLALAERPSPAVVVVTGILAFLVAGVGWPMLLHIITIAHEGGHATAASMAGGRVVSVELKRGGDGLTTSLIPDRRLTGAFVAAAGYLGPSVFGLLGCFMLVKGLVEAVLWTSLVLLAILLLNVINWFGRFSVVATGAVVFVVARYAPDGLQTLFAVTWVWFLLIGGFGHVIGLHRLRRGLKAAKKKDDVSDAASLRKLLWLPASFWVALFWLGSLLLLILGAGIMLGFVVEPASAPTPTPT